MNDLIEMNTDELKKHILKLNKKQLEKIAYMSKNYFLMEYIDLRKLKEDDFFLIGLEGFREEAEILKIYNNLLDSFIDLVENGRFNPDEIFSIREDLYDYSEVLSAYQIELKYIQDELNRRILKDREAYLDIVPALNLQKEKTIERIGARLDSLEGYPIESMNLMATVVNMVPFKLSKYKYYDLLTRNLMNNLKDYYQVQAEFQLLEYKKQFNGMLHPGYGLHFDKYFTEVEALKREDFEGKPIEMIKDLNRESTILFEEIGHNMMNIRRVGILCNRILTIGIISSEYGISIERDVLDKFLSDNEGIENLVRENFKKKEEELFDIVGDFKIYNDELYDRGIEDRELELEFDRAKSLLVYYNDLEFTSSEVLEAAGQDTRITASYLEQLVNSFIDFLKRNMKDLEVESRRARMKKLLTVLRPPFPTNKDFMGYLNYSLDSRIILEKELNLTVMSLNYYLDSLDKKE